MLEAIEGFACNFLAVLSCRSQPVKANGRTFGPLPSPGTTMAKRGKGPFVGLVGFMPPHRSLIVRGDCYVQARPGNHWAHTKNMRHFVSQIAAYLVRGLHRGT